MAITVKTRKNYLAEFIVEFFVILAVFVGLASSFVIVINTLNSNRDLTGSSSNSTAQH